MTKRIKNLAIKTVLLGLPMSVVIGAAMAMGLSPLVAGGAAALALIVHTTS